MKKHKAPKQQARKSASKIAARLAEAKRVYSEFCKAEAEMKSRAARVVDYIACLTNIPGTARQETQLSPEAVVAVRFSSERLEYLTGRMWIAGFHQTLRSLQDQRFGRQFLATADGRDLVKLSITRDRDEKLRIQKLIDFWDNLAKAKKFRTKRQTSRFAEESDLRADLAYFGILGQLQGKRFPDSLTIMEKFDPNRRAWLARLKASKKELDKKNAENLERNWRKLLDQCHVTPRKQRKRGPRNLGTG
jgi:hypothetical protein